MQTQKVIDHIVNWLKEYAVNSNAKGYVVGVSGGVDSGVVSTLCAMTGLEVLVLEMPIRQKKDQVNRAQEHIADLRKRFPNVKAILQRKFWTCNAYLRIRNDGESIERRIRTSEKQMGRYS